MSFYMTGRVPASRACNYLQNVAATTYKKFLQFYAKRSCKKHLRSVLIETLWNVKVVYINVLDPENQV